MSVDSQIEMLKTKSKSLFIEDIIGKDTCDNISDLLDHIAAFGDLTTVSLTIDVIDDLLGEIEQERIISDTAMRDLEMRDLETIEK